MFHQELGSNRYRFNGIERVEELGLYDYGARWYDPAIGRWTSVDPLADHPNQVMMSPYQYAWGDPVSLTDPDGKCPWCAAISTSIEYGSQVYSNYQSGHTGYDAWVGKVDFVDVAVEGTLGLIPGGKLVTAGKLVGGEVVKSSLDVTIDGEVSYVGDGTEGKDLASVAKDAGLNTVISAVGGKLNDGLAKGFGDDALKNAKSGLTAARKQSTKADNVAQNGGRSSARGYKGAGSGEARLQYNAAATRLHNTIMGRSFGFNNAAARQVHEEAAKKTIGVFVNQAATIIYR